MFRSYVAIISLTLLLSGSYAMERKELHEALLAHKEALQEQILEASFQKNVEGAVTQQAVSVPIFIYHSVRPHFGDETADEDLFDITPELLEQHLSYLALHGYTTITPDVLSEAIDTGTTTPFRKPVMLTFDDGWENQYTYAFPLLKKYHATATFYVFTNPIGKQKHFLTWEQLEEMDKAGMTIASHTLSHPNMTKISDEQLRHEIEYSKKVLEEHLHKPIRHFATPFGQSNELIESTIKESQYKTGRTTYRGVFHDSSDRYKLKAILVSDSIKDFIRILESEHS